MCHSPRFLQHPRSWRKTGCHIWMQEDTLAHWASTWWMEFNVTKCYTMHIMTTSQKKQAACIPYSMSGKELERVQNTKYLSVAINKHLSWEPHISATVAKAHKQLAFLDRNLCFCLQSLRETAYKTIMRPAIGYASPIWDPSSDREIRRLDTVQRHAACFVTGNPRKWHINHLPQWDSDTRLGWPSLVARHCDARCTLMFKIFNHLVAVPEDLVFTPIQTRTCSGTRNSLPHIRSRTELHRNSYLPTTSRDWNSLPSLPSWQTCSSGLRGPSSGLPVLPYYHDHVHDIVLSCPVDITDLGTCLGILS